MTNRYAKTVAFMQVENILVYKELIKEGLASVNRYYCRLPVCSDRWNGLEAEERFEKRDL